MSNEKQNALGMDCVIVWDDGLPLCIRAESQRAKDLFAAWGVEAAVDGIGPPDDAMAFITSVPAHWTCGMEPMQKESYKVQEIPLPQPKMVVH
jgi:hypothetical protein